MTEHAEVICGEPAAHCRCGLGPGHTGAHVCADEDCGGSWTGSYEKGDDFEVVAWPSINITNPLRP